MKSMNGIYFMEALRFDDMTIARRMNVLSDCVKD